MSSLIERIALSRLREWVDTFRVVVVNGPRQAGKSTLLGLLEREHKGTYLSLDEPENLRVALTDPTSFSRFGVRPLIIDEVQRAGDPLVLSIKRVVDTDPSPGQFVLSGSTRFLTVPTLSESLAGRAVFVELWPFAMAELQGTGGRFIDLVFDGGQELLGQSSTWERDDYLTAVCTGGYPEITKLSAASARRAWFAGYLETVISRDIESFAEVAHIELLPRLFALIADRSGTPLVVGDLANSLEISPTTVRNYLSYLETVFLVRTLRRWSSNLTSRVTKTPKTFVTDPGMAAYLLGVQPDALRWPGHRALGGLVETFVCAELVKLRGFADLDIELFHFRDRDGREIDFILEARDGRVVAIEVKATASVQKSDARHLRWLRDKLGDRFVAGIVIHLGKLNRPIEDRIHVMPLSVLWF